MGCCGASKYDFDLENSKNISDLINVIVKIQLNYIKVLKQKIIII